MEEPEVVQAARQFKAQLLTREQTTVLAMGAAWLRLEENISTDVDNLITYIDERYSGRTIPRSVLYRLDRYRALQAQLVQAIENFRDFEAVPRILAVMDQETKYGLAEAVTLTELSLQEAAIDLSFQTLPLEALEEIVALTQAQPVKTVLENMAPTGITAATDILIHNVAVGLNPKVTARQFMREGLAQSLNQALLVCRDMQNRAYRNTALEQYRQSGVISQYQRVATKDSRVCPACMVLDGEALSTEELMALHPQDRCSVIPVVKGMNRITWETASTWFERQTPNVQRHILGAGKYEMWRAGDISLGQLVTVTPNKTWGPHLSTTPIKRLAPQTRT